MGRCLQFCETNKIFTFILFNVFEPDIGDKKIVYKIQLFKNTRL